ncbi:MAG: hypothetical protein KDA90_17525 [Planctomycetaceae bacterium]|nr:hypothetical protein [Planctomycetaceae bacterium]
MATSGTQIDVRFTHLCCELAEAELARFGSPHVNKKEVGEELEPVIRRRTSSAQAELDLQFSRSQIICANEVFPESVSADPLADLEIWDEWRQSIRQFPFPGLYAPLQISEQKGKSTSTTSVGVLGEIMAGLLSQAYISPWVIVRPIKRWPDFIFLHQQDRYAFLESKAYTGTNLSGGHVLNSIPRATLHECIVDAVHQLNADPFISVWFSFTEIRQIDPFQLSVVFLELNANDAFRSQRKQFVPQAVVTGLSERAASAAAGRALFDVSSVGSARLYQDRDDLRSRARQASHREVDSVLQGTVPESLLQEVAAEVLGRTEQLIGKLKHREESGKRLVAAKERAFRGQIGELRPFGDDRLYLVDLTPKQRRALEQNWTPDWSQASAVWRHVQDTDFWRCSSAAVGLGMDELQGTRIDQ